MEDLLGFLAFAVFAGISIIARIMNSKKKEGVFTGGVTPQKKLVPKKRQAPATASKPIKQKVNQALQQYAAKPPAPPEQKPFLETHHEMTKKKSLIQEEPEPAAKPKPASPPLPVETPAPSYLSMADAIKSNRKFAIICHEILGKPKALED